MQLDWHPYKYYPYERELASREALSLLGASLSPDATFAQVEAGSDADAASRLTYFSQVRIGGSATATVQANLEDTGRTGRNRQATRYSVHGLHEYKGKFNPQVAKALMNIFGVNEGDRVLDPFCGSGTTLVEAAQIGAEAFGTDINPLAVFVANAKLLALRTPAADLERALDRSLAYLDDGEPRCASEADDTRAAYLRQWFDEEVFADLERLRAAISRGAGELAPVLLTVASDMLRDYSQQEPQDLRIRRRKSPMPKTALLDRWEADCRQRVGRLAAAQAVLPGTTRRGGARLVGAENAAEALGLGAFDAAITSPPYAMALPYIDTQRLSLVWLGLVQPGRLAGLEADLIGSRELRGSGRRDLLSALIRNEAALPKGEARLCRRMQDALGKGDGFRRQAVPILLYRYFAGMAAALRGVLAAMKPGAPFALIVGHNHTTLGGTRFDIDTPSHLANLAMANGWTLEETIPLQTYRRYGLHSSNAITEETLIVLRSGAA